MANSMTELHVFESTLGKVSDFRMSMQREDHFNTLTRGLFERALWEYPRMSNTRCSEAPDLQAHCCKASTSIFD